jgi:protein-S-isoprenylcysteine O-methyltransferase Ste14
MQRVHGERDASILPRLAMVGMHLVGVLVATWLLASDPLSPRRVALLACAWIYFLRLLATGLWLLKRRVGWAEAFQVGPFLLVIQVSLAWLGARATAPWGPVDTLALVLYGLGSFLNTGSELQRKAWKSHAEHEGRLYTGGLFRLSMHINYFGDVVLFSGFALLTRSLWAWLIPAIMLAGFVFVHIPTLDKYLQSRYGDEFAEWQRRTKKLVPFVY